MVISKCVPLEISRKKFSQFFPLEQPNGVVFVGWKQFEDENDNTKIIKKNVQIKYTDLEQNIIKAVKADPEWGQGGGGDTPDPPVDNPEFFEPVVVNNICAFPISLVWEKDETGEETYSRRLLGEGGTWDEDNQTNIVNLQNKQGFVEINAGGKYIEDYIMFRNPVIGTITNVVVDNTGLPKNESEYISPLEGEDGIFTLYYGMGKYDENNNPLFYEILTVPPMCRGIVQILHTEETDVIIHSSYSEAVGIRFGEEQETAYVADMISEDDKTGEYGDINYGTNDPVDKTPTGTNDNMFDIDMKNQRGYIEFQTRGEKEYTFWFSNPELGTSTYIVIDNSGALYKHDVAINYGKRMDEEDDKDDWYYQVTTVEQEKCVIEVFHSYSADIIVKVTKL